MRLALFALLAVLDSCSSTPSTTSSPPQNTSTATRIPTDLGRLVIVTASARADATPGFVPINTQFPLVDPAKPLPANTQIRVVDARGTSGTFVSSAPTKILFGCDGNQLDVTPFTGSKKLAPGIAWAVSDSGARPTANVPVVVSVESSATYRFGDLAVIVERDAQKKDRGELRFVVNDEVVGWGPFERTLMDGADPSMATLDMREGGPAIPVALAAWSIDGSGHAPFLVAIERPSWEGTSIEGWLVTRSVKQIEAMTTYLYQCAF